MSVSRGAYNREAYIREGAFIRNFTVYRTFKLLFSESYIPKKRRIESQTRNTQIQTLSRRSRPSRSAKNEKLVNMNYIKLRERKVQPE